MLTLKDLQQNGWESGINQVVMADCLEAMKLIPDKSVDLILTDPPYGMKKAAWDKRPSIEFIKELPRILKPDAAVYLFCADNCYVEFRNELDKYFHHSATLIWEKENLYGGGDYLIAHEYCLYYKQGRPVFNNIGRPATSQALKGVKTTARSGSVFRTKGFNNTCAEKTSHPTQKPIQLVQLFIENSSTLSGLILDPFMGSWTTARACKDLGRNFIGFELEEDYCKVGEERLRQENLF